MMIGLYGVCCCFFFMIVDIVDSMEQGLQMRVQADSVSVVK